MDHHEYYKVLNYECYIKDWEFVSEKAVVVAQLEERLLPTPENHGSNTVIGKFSLLPSTDLKRKHPYLCHLLTLNTYQRTITYFIRRSNTAWLTSCLTGFDSAALFMF